MISHQTTPHGAQSLLHGGNLHHDVGAVTVLFDHARQTSYLSLDALQSFQIRRFNFWDTPRGLARAALNFAGDGRRNTASGNTSLHVHIPPGGIMTDARVLVNPSRRM